jgi:hypothetical protein
VVGGEVAGDVPAGVLVLVVVWEEEPHADNPATTPRPTKNATTAL